MTSRRITEAYSRDGLLKQEDVDVVVEGILAAIIAYSSSGKVWEVCACSVSHEEHGAINAFWTNPLNPFR
jgi:hypothetical protein